MAGNFNHKFLDWLRNPVNGKIISAHTCPICYKEDYICGSWMCDDCSAYDGYIHKCASEDDYLSPEKANKLCKHEPEDKLAYIYTYIIPRYIELQDLEHEVATQHAEIVDLNTKVKNLEVANIVRDSQKSMLEAEVIRLTTIIQKLEKGDKK